MKRSTKDKLKGFLGAVAPVLGTAVGGPFGALAGKMVQDALGVNSDAAAVKMLETNPDAMVKLKAAETAFKQRLAELEIEEEALHQRDRSDARAMAIATTLKPQIIIAGWYLSGYFAVLAYILYLSSHGIMVDDTVRTLMSAFGVGVPIVLQFFFGSSAGSKQKTALQLNE